MVVKQINAKEQLIKLGLKEVLLNKLKNNQLQELVSFFMNHSKASNLQQMLIQLASMEVNGKEGAIFLASHGIASTVQLKNLSIPQVELIVGDYKFNQNEALAIKMVKSLIIENQQSKLESHGLDAVKENGDDINIKINQF